MKIKKKKRVVMKKKLKILMKIKKKKRIIMKN